jgi:hypothetical protein
LAFFVLKMAFSKMADQTLALPLLGGNKVYISLAL